MRRSNPIFYGIEDFQNESWAQSEKEVIGIYLRFLISIWNQPISNERTVLAVSPKAESVLSL